MLVVMSLEDDESTAYNKDHFHDQDIEVEDLVVDESSRLSFSVVDRFITVARLCPGPVAIHCGSNGLENGHVSTLVVFSLIHHLRFEPNAAVAWVRMLLPELLVQDPAAASPPCQHAWTRHHLDSFEDLPEKPSRAAASGRCKRRNSVSASFSS